MMGMEYYEIRQKQMDEYLDALAKQGYAFRMLQCADREMYLRYEPQSELSSRCFLSQFSYAQEDCICCWEDREDGCLLLLTLNLQGELSAYPPLFAQYDPDRFAAATRKIRAVFELLALPMQVEHATGEDVERFTAAGFACRASASEDDADYIYEFAQFRDFEGGKNANRRRKHNRFLNRHQAELEPLHAGNIEEAEQVLNGWCALHTCADGVHRCPKCVGIRALRHLDSLNALGYMVRVDSQAQAVILLGYMSENMLDVLTICSVNRELGMEETLYALAAQTVPPQYVYMNLEEDMGVEWMRQHKRSLRPCRMQNKYMIRFESI